MRRMLAASLAIAFLLAACEKPDYSFQTSPSARALAGTTTGNVALAPPEAAPAPVEPPDGWEVSFELAVFNRLEDETRALRVLSQVQTKAGLGMELWLSNEQGVVARWSGGSTDRYNGVVCWQMRLEDAGEALTLPPGAYTATLAFRDVEDGVIAARQIKVTGTVPRLEGSPPGPDSRVFRDLLGCPRGS